STLMRHGDRARAKAGAFVQEARGGTPMHGALWFAAADLLARPEPRRVILVLTDGQPADREATGALLAQCTAAGLETLGIGIGIDVSGLFASAIQVQDIAELKTQLFGAAERLLLAA
ncbi:VWA domain-containing protein, partial [Lamprobacter modestohalophilus]|nr:VWA domain-containing protein [Lamprobacter modestohalophilus]